MKKDKKKEWIECFIIHYWSTHSPSQGEEVAHWLESITCNTIVSELDHWNYSWRLYCSLPFFTQLWLNYITLFFSGSYQNILDILDMLHQISQTRSKILCLSRAAMKNNFKFQSDFDWWYCHWPDIRHILTC